MARPKKVINQKQFEGMCAIQCTKEDICNILEITDKTLDKWCHETYGESFSVVFNQKKANGKMSLRRQQWKVAESGNPTMLVWLGKNMLKQSDNPLQDEIKLRELALKEREFELKEKLMLKQLDDGNTTSSDVAQALRDIFGSGNSE